jgi:hypothetical protein
MMSRFWFGDRLAWDFNLLSLFIGDHANMNGYRPSRAVNKTIDDIQNLFQDGSGCSEQERTLHVIPNWSTNFPD